MRDKHLRFIRVETGVDVSALGDTEVKKLAEYCLKVIASETPMVAKAIARANMLEAQRLQLFGN